MRKLTSIQLIRSLEVIEGADAIEKATVLGWQVVDAKESGATIYAEPQDHGWMYQHSFADLDGHQWELVYMDASQLPNQ